MCAQNYLRHSKYPYQRMEKSNGKSRSRYPGAAIVKRISANRDKRGHELRDRWKKINAGTNHVTGGQR